MAGQKKEVESNGQWDPKVLVFACNWCSYAGADTAGVSRIQYSPGFRVIRVMCSGRVRTSYILKAFQLGADGVLVSGCHIGDCHYIFGNHRAIEMFERTKKTLKVLGFEDKRIRLEWVSAAEGIRWGEVIDEFVDDITKLGPSPVNRKALAEAAGGGPAAPAGPKKTAAAKKAAKKETGKKSAKAGKKSTKAGQKSAKAGKA